MPAIDLPTIIAFIPTLIGLWVIVSVPVYISAKIVTSGRASFVQAMGATVLGPLAYVGVLLATMMAVGSFTDMRVAFLPLIIALVAWLGVFKASFKTGWLAAIGIAALAVIVFIVAGLLIGFALIMFMPDIAPQPLPLPLHQV